MVSLLLLAACLVFIAGDGTRGAFLWAMISLVITLSLVMRMHVRTLLTVGVALLVMLFVLSSVKKYEIGRAHV